MFTYKFDFKKAYAEDSVELKELKEYLFSVAEANSYHVSVLVNNVATPMLEFAKLEGHEVTRQTNNKIDNHTFVTETLMKEVRDKGLKTFSGSQYRSAVINVGVLEGNLVESKIKFKNKAEESDYDVYKATSNYQT